MFDNHVHSNFSVDSSMTIEEAVRAAVSSHLSGLAITDHFDFDSPERTLSYEFDPDAQQAEVAAVQASWRARGVAIELCCGIELGVQPQSTEKAREFAGRHRFDTVILSQHYIDGCDPYIGGYYDRYDAHTAYMRYLEQIWTSVRDFGDFDILGHYDYITRYSPYKEHCISLREYGDVLDPLLQYLAYNGKTFEINTKTYRAFSHGTPELDLDILRRFRHWGGEAVSLGSDAHGADRVGDGFDAYIRLLQSCGFRYGVHYVARKPVFEKLEACFCR